MNLTTTPVKPYTALHLKHFPVETFITASGVEIHPMWSGEGNISYLLVNPKTRDAFLIDPDLEILGSYLLTLDMQKLNLVAAIDTHTHAEHATAGPSLLKLFKMEYLMNHHASSSFVTVRLEDTDEKNIAGIKVKFMYSPGHTPDLQVVMVDNHIFTGDSLFNKSCGRADLPGGDAGQQFDTLQRLMQLPDDTIVHPGHDYNGQLCATLAAIKRENKRVQIDDRNEFIRFMTDFYAGEEKPDNLAYYVAFNAR